MRKIKHLISRVRDILRDAEADSWTDAMIATWLAEGELMVLNYKPEALIERIEFACQAGSEQWVKQDEMKLIPDGILGIDGHVSGESIIMLDVAILEKLAADWRQLTPTAAPGGYVTDRREPLKFWCVPQATKDTRLIVRVYCLPKQDEFLAQESLDIGVEFDAIVMEWALYKAFGCDTEGTPNQGRAAKAYQVFYESLGIDLKNDQRFSQSGAPHE